MPLIIKKSQFKYSHVDLVIISISLFLSGFCGIAYEVLYARILGNLIGNHFVVNASLFVTFLFGIGLGTKFAFRLSGFLWTVEGGIGLFAILFTSLMPWADRLIYTHISSGGIGLSILISCIILACPAFLIGISLPLFAAYLKKMVEGQVFSICYMVYNFGAAVTTVLIEFFL